MKNDYELLYLIRGENDQIAFEYLFNKYERLIWKNIHLLNIENIEREDFIQEGILMLYKAIQTFDEFKNKTFTRYFELILKRHFYHMKKKIPKFVYNEYILNQQQSYYLEEDHSKFLEGCSLFEQEVFELYFIENKSAKYIQETTQCSLKQVYNAIYRLKEKYKKYVII
ncbi:MAG: sigma-70 family RNA polymerase sigma factor [Acholeplasmataceae bacterium]